MGVCNDKIFLTRCIDGENSELCFVGAIMCIVRLRLVTPASYLPIMSTSTSVSSKSVQVLSSSIFFAFCYVPEFPITVCHGGKSCATDILFLSKHNWSCKKTLFWRHWRQNREIDIFVFATFISEQSWKSSLHHCTSATFNERYTFISFMTARALWNLLGNNIWETQINVLSLVKD